MKQMNSYKGQAQELTISKSLYVESLKCPLRAWLRANDPEKAEKPSPSVQQRFRVGHEIGRLAQTLFPGGVLVGNNSPNWPCTLEATCKAIASGGGLLFEGAFENEACRVRTDILEKEGDSFRLIEVKQGCSAKPEYIQDVAFQAHILHECGLDILACEIMHLNREYVRDGDLEVEMLFVREDVTDAVGEILPEMASSIKDLRSVLLDITPPRVTFGTKCNDCPFKAYCHRDLPVDTVYQLPRAGKAIAALLAKGITRLGEVPVDFPLTDRQRAVVETAHAGTAIVKKGALEKWLSQLQFPLYMWDVESTPFAVPPFESNCAPYTQLPFQFSLHTMSSPAGEIAHDEFLTQNAGDPRRDLVEHLLDCIGSDGSVVVYNKSFEAGILTGLAKCFPEYRSALECIRSRLVDMMDPFATREWADPAFKGKCSLKAVAPALAPELSYETVGSVKKGDEASLAFELFAGGRMSSQDWISMRRDMLAYCHLDTWSMVRIYQLMCEIVGMETGCP